MPRVHLGDGFQPDTRMPLRAWNKLAMMVQSTISLVLMGLVIVRAVNVLTWGRRDDARVRPGRTG